MADRSEKGKKNKIQSARSVSVFGFNHDSFIVEHEQFAARGMQIAFIQYVVVFGYSVGCLPTVLMLKARRRRGRPQFLASPFQ
jgi:hypothetical protein